MYVINLNIQINYGDDDIPWTSSMEIRHNDRGTSYDPCIVHEEVSHKDLRKMHGL